MYPGLIHKAEREIVTKVVEGLLAHGYLISVSFERGYGPHEVTLADNLAAVLTALQVSDTDKRWATVDFAHLIVEHKDTGRKGWVWLIWGNGPDVISDYTCSLEEALKAANAYAEELS